MLDHAVTGRFGRLTGSYSGEAAGAQRTERHVAWGRAYRNGQLVCPCVRITVGHDDGLGLTRRERRYVIARFQDRLDGQLRTELIELTRRRGAAAYRAAERIDPIELVLEEPGNGCQRIVGRLQPPQLRHGGGLRDIEFGVRELERAQ
jgi:hypothetical protein